MRDPTLDDFQGRTGESYAVSHEGAEVTLVLTRVVPLPVVTPDIEALRAKQLRLADDASRRLTRAVADAAEVLTPAQRKDLAAHFARRHGRWTHG